MPDCKSRPSRSAIGLPKFYRPDRRSRRLRALRGLCGEKSGATRGGAAYQSWNLDGQGNWNSFTSGGATQTRTANAQNQITSISGQSTPTYDANGNLISASLTSQPAASDTLIYDAWNRLVEVKNASGQMIAQYTYDARGYRVTESYPQGGNGIAAGTTNYIYYDSNWQAVEVRTNGTANSDVTGQTVWSAAYINAAVLQDTYSGGVIQPNSRLYFIQDANWNTTAVVGYDSTTQTWGVVQRYTYSPYGTITILNSDWSTPSSGTQPLVNNLYQGMALDSVTGLYHERARWYSPSLGTWISQDPAGYINGANTYQFVMGNPVGRVDPAGLFWGWLQNMVNAFNSAGYSQAGFVAPGLMGNAVPPDQQQLVDNYVGHMTARAGQAFWDLATNNQQFMNALSASDQPLNQVLIDRLKQAERQPHGARPGCGGQPQSLAQLQAAIAAEKANNAANFAAIAANANGLHTAIGKSLDALVATGVGALGAAVPGAVIGAASGGTATLGGVTAGSLAGRLVGGGIVATWGTGGSLLGGQIAGQLTGVPPGFGGSDAGGAAANFVDGLGGLEGLGE